MGNFSHCCENFLPYRIYGLVAGCIFTLLTSLPVIAQDFNKPPFRFPQKNLNVAVLESQENLDAAIVLTALPRGFFLDGDIKDHFLIKWQPQIPATLRYSTIPGGGILANYPNEIKAHGSGQLLLNPAKEGLRTGIYYCILVSDENPEATSVEFIIVVQANAVPVIISPVGTVNLQDGPPLFRWDAVEGVPYYLLLLSENPVSIERDDDGNIIGLKGLVLSWVAITPTTFLNYGDADPSGNFLSIHVPPLLPGIKYNWVVLNSYGAGTDLISGEVAPVAPSFFEVTGPTLSEKPQLLEPLPDATLTEDEIIFRWTPVQGAERYRFVLYEGRDLFESNLDFIIWSQITTDTQVRFKARGNLVRTRYSWRVIAEGPNAISYSDRQPFKYGASAGWAKFVVQSSTQLLSRVEIKMKDEAGNDYLIPSLTDTFGVAEQPLPSGRYSFVASRAGFLTTPRQFFDVPDNDTVVIHVMMERSSTSISGQVVDENGNPIFDATVVLQQGTEKEVHRTDFVGYFSFTVSPGNWTLRVSKQGFNPSESKVISLQGDQSVAIGQIVLSRSTNRVQGQVRFAPGNQSASGILVHAISEDLTYQTTTGAQGGFIFDLPDGHWTISLEPRGFYASPPEFVFDLTGNQEVSANFQLFSGGLVYGKILFREFPVTKARVQAFNRQTGELVQTVFSSEQGDYSLGLPAGEYEIVVSKPNFLEARQTISLGAGQTLLKDFTLDEAGFVKGTVINLETFEPVAGALVFVLPDSTNRTRTDAQGKYVLSLPPGIPFQIDASLSGFESNGPFTVTTSAGDTVFQDILLKAQSGTIRGQVTDGFFPIPEALVKIEELNLEQLTDENGRFEFVIPPGFYHLSISKECHFTSKKSVSLVAGEVEQVNVTLEALKSIITGKVMDVGGFPIEGARVAALGDTSFFAFSDSAGFYQLCLNGGFFRIEASQVGYLSADTVLVISDGDSLGNLNFILKENFARLTGVVLDTSGNPVSEARVVVQNEHQTLSDTTDINGIYRIRRIVPGNSEIVTQKEGFYGDLQQIFLMGQEQRTLNLTLFPADGFIRGTVRDAQDSTAIPDVEITAVFSRNPSEFFKTTTNNAGQYLLENLPVVPGASFQVFAFKEGFSSPEPKTSVPAKSSNVDFYLTSKSGSITGVVQDKDTGEPIYRAKIEATNRQGGRSLAFSDSSGIFVVKNLVPDVPYNLAITKKGFFAQVISEIQPGTQGLVVNLQRRYGVVKGEVYQNSPKTPLESVKIVAVPNGSSGRPTSVLSNGDGTYQLFLIEDNYIIRPEFLLHRSEPPFVQLRVTEGDTIANVDFILEPQNVQTIAIQRTDQRVLPTISNQEIHCYEAVALDNQNRPVNIGPLEWSVDVSPQAAFMDSAGCLHLNPNFFGDLTIFASVPEVNLQGQLSVDVFAPVDSTTEARLFDDRGLQLEIIKNSVKSPKNLLVSRQPVAPAKKGRAEFFISDSSYVLKPAGLVFNEPVNLYLIPPPNSENQKVHIARWDERNNQWIPIVSTRTGANQVRAPIQETGEYVALAISKPLSLENIRLTPNPFSPYQETDGGQGLKIEFDLSSNTAPNPLFTAKIYNLEGNLVRVLHDQTPFPRGHSIIYWDGTTDSGAMARNGRYIVRFIIEDPIERKEIIKTVVLIK